MRAHALVLLAAALSSGVAHAAVPCQAKGGQLVVRETCRKRERPVDPAAFAVPGPSGAPGAPGAGGAAPAFPLRMVDADGAAVGDIVDFERRQAVVQLPSPPLPSPLLTMVRPDGFVTQFGLLVYTSTDCSGTAYMPELRQQFAGDDVPPIAGVWGEAMYYPTGPRQDVMANSFESAHSMPCTPGTTPTPRGTCCGQLTETTPGQAPAARIPLSDLGVTPPFRAVPR